ncbi:MAG: hypothetical protein LBB49_02355, partial [Gracilibacteraceae bacterium]|nr:hypothetical protein [Gracilibacteraceae bacterium]
MMPNTASQVSSIKRLKKKGYDIIYDDMLVMPSNFAIATKELLALKLLEVLPDKVAEIVKTIASGVRSQTTPVWLDRFFSKLGELEKPGAHSFGKYVEITEACNGCGWCA